MKKSPQSEGRGFVQCGIFRTMGVLQMRPQHFLDQKITDISQKEFFRCDLSTFWSKKLRIFRKRGSSDATSALFGAKNYGLFEIMICPQGQGGIEPLWILRIWGGGRGSQFFTTLCGRLLWTAPDEF